MQGNWHRFITSFPADGGAIWQFSVKSPVVVVELFYDNEGKPVYFMYVDGKSQQVYGTRDEILEKAWDLSE